jgi:hypothetical protein
MAFDFPNTPSVGDLFQDSTSGAVYKWNGYAWVGGVTGIGLQTIKETRYLVAGSFTHTRDPKSNGFADIFLLGAQGGRSAQVWASGQLVCAGSGAAGSIGIKWKYALPASAPVIVGASSGTAQAGASSFDTALSAPGGFPGAASTAAATANQTATGGASGGAATGCDESYVGQVGHSVAIIAGYGASSGILAIPTFLRGISRRPVSPTASASASISALLGDPGAVFVVEYLNP